METIRKAATEMRDGWHVLTLRACLRLPCWAGLALAAMCLIDLTAIVGAALLGCPRADYEALDDEAYELEGSR